MSGEDRPAPPTDAETITHLRGEGPRVVRLSRKAIGAASAAAVALVGGALVFALQPVSYQPREDLPGTDGIAVAQGLASAPKDYSQVPRLGPPLPGDLGGPILAAQDRGALAELPPAGASPPPRTGPAESARQAEEREREAARGSRLFFGSGTPASDLAQGSSEPGEVTESKGPAPTALHPAGLEDPRRLSPERLTAPPSATVLQAGSVIPAALITGIRSDRPGLVTAQVTGNVHDSLTGRHLLISQGARLIGKYASDVGFGQRRIELAWNRLILPDGRSILLEDEPGADAAGHAGLEDGVDNHWGGVFRAALVSTLLGVGSELGAGTNDDLARALHRGSQDSIGRAGEQVVARELDIRPTLTIRPGYPLRVLVTRDLVLEGGS